MADPEVHRAPARSLKGQVATEAGDALEQLLALDAEDDDADPAPAR